MFIKICFPVVALLIASSLWAADNNNIITVQCADLSGTPLKDVQVFIQHLQTQKWKDKKSDAKGTALFNKLDDGVYRVIGRRDGFGAAIYEFVLLKGGAQQTVSLKLQPGDPKAPVYFEDQAVGQKAFDALNRGVEALRANKLPDAEKELRVSLELNPSSIDAHFNLAIVLIQQRKWDEAEQELKRAQGLAAALSEMPQRPDATGPNPYVEMKSRVEEVIAKIPALKLRDEGDKALAAKNFDEAIAKYQEAVKADPNDPDLFYNLALAQANAKRYNDAEQSVAQAIKLKPGEAGYKDLQKRLGDIKVNEALAQAKTILEAGDALYQKNDFAGALKKYEEAMPLIPESRQAGIWAQVGRTYGKMNNPDEAVKAFNKAIAISPDDPTYRKALAQYYMNEKKYDQALNLYADPKAAGSDPADKVLFNLGAAQNKAGNAEVAILAFEKVIQINPQNAEAYYELGALYFYEKKDNKRAAEMLNKYVEIGKDNDHINNAKSLLVVISRKK